MTTNTNSSSALAPVDGTIVIQRLLLGVWVAVVAVLSVHPAFASGADTSSETWSAIQTWLNTWIPLMCAVGLIVIGIGWGVLHMIPATVGWKAVLGMIIAGSASYLVSLTGLAS